jgi:hypothetical protein
MLLFAATADCLKARVMRSIIMVAVMFGVLIVVGGCATFQNPGPPDTVADYCKTEIDSYCKDVTQREGRILSCLYASSDKLSNRCENALNEAVSHLRRAVL